MVQTMKHGKPDGTDDGGNYKIEMNPSSRKSNKPMMERKRRARINDSLNQLKSLVLNASGKEESNFSKLDKADILEMTVQHIATIQQNGTLGASMEGSANFMGGFSACAKESLGLLSTLAEVTGVTAPANLQAGLFNHLTSTQCRLSPEIKPTQQLPAYVHVQSPSQSMGRVYDPNRTSHQNPGLLRDPRTSSNPIKGEQLADHTMPPLQRAPPTGHLVNTGPVAYPIHVTVPHSSFPQPVSSNAMRIQPNICQTLPHPSIALSPTVKLEPLDVRDYDEAVRDLSDSASESSQSPSSDGSPDSKSAWRPW